MSATPQGPGWWKASDGNWYPPQPQAPPSQTPPPAWGPPPYGPPPSSGMSGWVKALLAVVIAVMVLGLGSCVAAIVLVDEAVDEVNEDLATERVEEMADVGDPTCSVDAARFMAAEVSVVNNSSERSNYSIEITFEAGGTQLATGIAAVSALGPGQTTTATASSLAAPPADGQFTCQVVDVQRFSDEV